MSERRYALVIFDFDGTLADSAGWFGSVINSVARRYGFREVTAIELEPLRGTPPAAAMRQLGVASWKIPLVARHMRKIMARDIDQIRPFPGIERVLRDLHSAGLRLAIVSSNAEANIRQVLGPETAALFDLYACGASLEGKGPKFRRVLKRAGVAAADALAIGDEVRDIDAANGLGMAAGAVTWGYASPEMLRARSPTVMFEHVEEMRSLASGRVT